MLRSYYENEDVRRRMMQFLGGESLQSLTCVYVAPQHDSEYVRPMSPQKLWCLLEHEFDVRRSLWDRHYLIAHLDLEYVNFDLPGEPYCNPERIFALQRPVVRVLDETLRRHGIAPLHLLSGRGHHYVWSIRQDSAVHHRLACLGRLPETLHSVYAQPHPPAGEVVEPELGRAFAGLGLVMEYLGHHVLREATPACQVSVQLTAVEVGRGERGREIVSFDLSEYGDPLHLRTIPIPYSAYLKAYRQLVARGESLPDAAAIYFLIPADTMDEAEGITTMRDKVKVMRLARQCPAPIPDYTDATAGMIRDYERSPLARFHEWFYAQEQNPPSSWPQTYDRTPLEVLPPCARTILEHPNELLLKPAGLQHVTRIMMALGWHPRHIAGLIRSKYERNYGWGSKWFTYDACTRAEFYTRLFAGLVATGRDELVDMNNISQKEKGWCFREECGYNLMDWRRSLLARREHERLGCRPFNRLFL